MKQAVFLDRDGVLVKAIIRDGRPFSPRSRTELEIMPDAADSCLALRRAGFVLIVVTNQPDVARGQLSPADLSAMHEELISKIPLDAVLFCPHDDNDGCDCRKPAPGLLLSGADRWGVELAGSVMVGDRWRDIEAGRRAGCRTVFIDAGYAERRAEGADLTVKSLTEALPWILATVGDAT